MRKTLYLIFGGAALAQTAFASDLGYDPTKTTGEISTEKQYIVSTSCRYRGNLSDYMRRLDKFGNYKPDGNRPAGAVKVGHVVGFVTSETSGFSDAYSSPSKVVANELPTYTVFARDVSGDPVKNLRRTSLDCRARWMVTGLSASKIKVASIFASSSKAVGADLVASILVFSKALVGAGRQLLLNKGINASLEGDLDTANQLVSDFETFSAIFSGEAFDDLGAKPLRVGVQRVFTAHSDFFVTVEESDSFLRSALPFWDNANTFLNSLDQNYWGSKLSEELNSEERTAFRSKCEGFVTHMLGNGLVAKDDQAYLLARSLILKGVSKVNLMRCFWDANLHETYFQKGAKTGATVRDLISGRHHSSAIFNSSDFENWQRSADNWDIRAEDWKPQQKLDFGNPENAATAIERFLGRGSFYPFLDAGVDPEDHPHRLKVLNSAFLPKVLFLDFTGKFSNKELLISPVEVVRVFSGKGHNRLGCSKKATAANVNALGKEYFGEAQFVFLAHLADPLTYENKDRKILHPDRAIVVRGFTDPSTNKISVIETTLKPAGVLFDASKTCSALKEVENTQRS